MPCASPESFSAISAGVPVSTIGEAASAAGSNFEASIDRNGSPASTAACTASSDHEYFGPMIPRVSAPNLREVGAGTFAPASTVVIDTEHAGAECGDIMAAEDAGTWPAGRVVTLPEAIAADGDWVRPSGAKWICRPPRCSEHGR